MLKTLVAGFVYFLLVLGTGFVLGMLRVPFLVPRIGERWAELLEMPLMAVTIFYSAEYIVRRFPEVNSPAQSLAVGFLALVLTLCTELGLALAIQSQNLVDYLASRDKVSGSVYLLMLVVFALMPRLCLKRSGSRNIRIAP